MAKGGRKKGDFGEECAKNYLESLGYTILDRNYTVRGGELDIIAKEDNTLCFIEVKTRKSFDSPAAGAITNSKLSKILYAAEYYLHQKGENAEKYKVRFDCIEVYLVKIAGVVTTRINHIKDIDVT